MSHGRHRRARSELSPIAAALDRGREFRNRLLASPRFQRLALRFPLTRGVARRRARRVFDLCAGFVYSQVLLACVELGLFELLAEGSRSTSDVAERTSLSPAAARRLLAAAASLGLVERRGADRFGLGQAGAVILGNDAITAMVRHHRILYADLADPVALLRGEGGGTGLSRYWPYARSGSPAALEEDDVAGYGELMAASQSLVAEQVLDAYPLGRHRCLLDVGGGEGAFLAAVADRVPVLRCILFDLPAVARRARARLAAKGLSERVTVVGGDFHVDPLPDGADVVSLVRVVHDHGDPEALALLHAVRRCMEDGAVLLVAEPMSGTSGAEPIGDAYFGFYLLAMGSGRAREPGELMELIRQAGFEDVRLLRTRMPLQTGLIIARAARIAREDDASQEAPSSSSPRASSSGRASRNHGV